MLPLRKEWQRWLLENHIPIRLARHVSEHENAPLFTEAETAWLRESFRRFSSSLSPASDWDFAVDEGQPYCLAALERLSTIMGDRDTTLFPALKQGIPTGFDDDIPRSHTLRPRQDAEPDSGHDLLVCEGNWLGAESDPALLQELIEEEISAGYLEEMPDLESAYKRWGKDRVAVGKVNIVKAPGRSPRLVVDNSICNTNQNCFVPEQFSLPSLQDIEAAFPPREDEEEVSGFSLDVKGAHKTSRVREGDRGLLGMRQQERLLFYRVCPFGARFSSHWFARIGGFLIRCLQLLIWISHILLLYVDDLLLFQNRRALPLSASLVLAFCSCFNVPLSWRKLQLGPTITWIGWELNLSCGCFTLPDSKRLKLHQLVQECLQHRLVNKRQLDKLLGLLQWILHGFPGLRPRLSSVDDDLHRPLGTNVSVNPTYWAGMSNHLDEELHFTSSPPGTCITSGAKLLSARHVNLQNKLDLHKVPVTTKRIWMRVADPTSSRRRLSQMSRETLQFLLYISSMEWRPRPLRQPRLARVESVADAFGKGNERGIGGWLRFPNNQLRWFSQRFTVQDFTQLEIPRWNQMPTSTSPATRPWRNASSCFASGAQQVAAAWLYVSRHSVTTQVQNQYVTSFIPRNNRLIFLFASFLCGVRSRVSAWNAATYLAKRTRTLMCFPAGTGHHPCLSASRLLSASKCPCKTSGTSAFKCNFSRLTTFYSGTLQKLTCWAPQCGASGSESSSSPHFFTRVSAAARFGLPVSCLGIVTVGAALLARQAPPGTKGPVGFQLPTDTSGKPKKRCGAALVVCAVLL